MSENITILAIGGALLSVGTFRHVLQQAEHDRASIHTALPAPMADIRAEVVAAIREGRPAVFFRKEAGAEAFKDTMAYCTAVELSYQCCTYHEDGALSVRQWLLNPTGRVNLAPRSDGRFKTAEGVPALTASAEVLAQILGAVVVDVPEASTDDAPSATPEMQH